MGATGNIPENFGGNYYLKPRVFVDENGNGVIAYLYNDGTYWEVYAAYTSTTSGVAGAWSSVTGTAGTSGKVSNSNNKNRYIGGLYIRENKAVILINTSDNAQSEITICDYDSGVGGYKTWSAVPIGLATDFSYTRVSFVFIQYDAFQNADSTHADCYRIVVVGQQNSITDVRYETFDGNGASTANSLVTGGSGYYTSSATMDLDDGNNIILHLINASTSNDNYTIYTNTSLSSPLSWSTVYNVGLTANGGTGKNIQKYNGYSSQANIHWAWNNTKRLILKGDCCYIVIEASSLNGSAIGIALLYTNDLTGNNWKSYINVGEADINKNEQEPCIQYIPSINSLVIAFRQIDSLTEAQHTAATGRDMKIFSRLLEIDGSGVLIPHDLEEISNSTSSVGMMFTTIAGSSDSCMIGWEQYGGSYDLL